MPGALGTHCKLQGQGRATVKWEVLGCALGWLMLLAPASRRQAPRKHPPMRSRSTSTSLIMSANVASNSSMLSLLQVT